MVKATMIVTIGIGAIGLLIVGVSSYRQQYSFVLIGVAFVMSALGRYYDSSLAFGLSFVSFLLAAAVSLYRWRRNSE